MASLSFNIMKKGPSCQIYIVIRHRNALMRKYTGFKIPEKDWNGKKQRVKTTSERATIINSYLSGLESKFDLYVDDCVRSVKDPNVTKAMQVLLGGVVTQTVRSLPDGFDLYIKSIENTHDTDTTTKYTVMRDQVIEYEKYSKSKVALSDVTEEFYNDLIKFLINKHNNTNVTIRRKITRIKTVMRYLVSKRIYQGTEWNIEIELKTFKVSNKVPLTPEERTVIWNYTTTDLLRKSVIDGFILSIYTGLRYSDVEQLQAHHIHKTDTGEYYIHMSTEKGDQDHIVGIPSFVYDRLKLYFNRKGPVFNLTDSQTCNDILKATFRKLKLEREIEWKTKQGNQTFKEKVKICDKISFHFGRYTYTRLLDDAGVDAKWMQKNLAHSKFATTEKYLKGDDIKRVNDTNKRLAI